MAVGQGNRHKFMKIKTSNAYRFIKHLKALAAVTVEPEGFTGLPEFHGLEMYHKLNRLELKLHRLQETSCNRELTAAEEKQEEALTQRARMLIRPEYRAQFFVNGDPRGYSLKLHNPEQKEAGRKYDGFQPLPEGLDQDWGGYGLLASEF